MGIFLWVAQDMVLSHRAKFQLIINFFRVKAISTGLTCRSTLKNYFVIADLEKKFAIKAQQILYLPIRKRKIAQALKKRHRAQRKLQELTKKA